jgi:hypothetical protein
MKCTYLTFEDPMDPAVHLREFLPDCCSPVHHQCRTRRRRRRRRREEAASEEEEKKRKMKIKKRIACSF